MSFTFNKTSLLIFTLSVLHGAQPVWCQELLPTAVRVDESKIIREVPEQLFGINHNWIHSEQLVWDQREDRVSTEFEKLFSEFSLPLNRMAGSDSQIFNWKQAIGPLAIRTEQLLAPHDKKGKKKFGPLEWIASTRAVDPEARFTWVFNLKTENPSDNADLVEFLTCDGSANPNGGIHWGRKRIQFGLTSPVPIEIWELGNEMDWAGGEFDWSLNEYISECKRIIKAVQGVDPNAALAVQAATAPMGRHYRFKDWREWHRAVLRELGHEIDYITFHAYYFSGVPISIIEKYLDVIRDDIVEITGSNRIKIYISEHAVWPTKPKGKEKAWRDNWYETQSLSGCLLTAQFINRLLQRQEVAAAAYHSFSAGPWGIFFVGKDGLLYSTGLFDLFSVLNSALGENVVYSSVVGLRSDTTKKKLTFTATAMSVKDGLNILMVNREAENSRNIEFKFNGKYFINKVITITGESLESYNTEYVKNIFKTTKIIDPDKEFNEFIMPAKSVVVLKLKKMTS